MTVISCEYNKKYDRAPFSIDSGDRWTLLLIREPVCVRYPDGKSMVSSGFMLCSPKCKVSCISDDIMAMDRLVFMPDGYESALISELC